MHAASDSICPAAIVVFDIDGVIRDVGNSYRRALADTVEQFTKGAYRPTPTEIDALKAEGKWNNDWEASQELIYRYFETQGIDRLAATRRAVAQSDRSTQRFDYDAIVAFFQSRYRGTDPVHWNGYICQEPLLLQPAYLETLTRSQIAWGFFSGATRGSANYVLEKRLGLQHPVLVAMEDAPGKPDPTGLFDVVRQIEARDMLAVSLPVLYAGDTVADMYTVKRARAQQPDREWIGVGILPPHVQQSIDYSSAYARTLIDAGAAFVLPNIEQLDPTQVTELIIG